MKSKLNILIGVSLKRKIKTKWFVLANILLFILILGAINIDNIINAFGGNFDNKDKLYVIADENIFNTFEANIDKEKYEVIKYTKSEETANKKITDKKNSILIIFNNDNLISAKITTKEFLNTAEYTYLSEALQKTKVTEAIKNSNIDSEVLNNIYSQIQIERKVLDESKKSEEESMQMIMTTAFPIIILPFFMLTLFLVQMIGAEVNDEKSTRSMEIIISNISYKTHLYSKIVAANLFVLIQSILLFIYSLLGLLIRNLIGTKNAEVYTGIIDVAKEILNQIDPTQFILIIIVTLLLMILTFIAYSLLAGVLASMTTNTEDFQQLQTPIMVISLTGYYLAMMAGIFDGSLFIKILSFFPFISAILSPSLLMLGQINIIHVCISILVIIITIYLLTKYGLRIYKDGILNYSSTNLWKKMYKAMKKNI